MADHKYTNHLINETSPYLLQHVHNPVEWYAWNEVALERARNENKPILLSIGYSACHWCHVMERESFENERIADVMNKNFINIKVDREERPDIDQIYMNAVQMMTGHGGWPLTVFLTPDLTPFFGGTYFPPEDRYNMPGFPRVLEGVAEAYRSRPADVKETAGSILSELRRMNVSSESNELLTVEMLDVALRGMARNYDRARGGFGGAPKFPAPMNLEFVLRVYHRTNNSEALEMVTHTCRRMAEGGMYDQLGGGFHRYSTDAAWLVPHFEKMLYDNALLSRLYLHVYQATGDNFFHRIARETFDYVVREMTDERGGFYSTQDADSEGEEGKFFVWSEKEITEILGEQDAKLFNAYYGVTRGGNFEGHNILNVSRSMEEVAREESVSAEDLKDAIDRGRRKLFVEREKRIKPGRDEKILTAWNGIMMASFAEAAAILDRPDYARIAERNAEFLIENLWPDRKLLLHGYKDGRARFNAYLDDYSYLAAGLLALYETTGTLRWLEDALEISRRMIEEFWDEEEGGFFYTGTSHEQLIVRTKDFFDNATPSGNSVAAEVLLRLSVLTGEEDFRRRAVTIFRLLRNHVARYPSAFGRLLGALDFHLGNVKEIVVIGGKNSEDTGALVHEAWKAYLPNKVVVQAEAGDERAAKLIPLLRERQMIEGRATVYVCENQTCQLGVTTTEELAAQLNDQAG
jgi:uncharacterized protein